VNVYDIDDGHKLVKTIDVPHAGKTLRGICGSVQTHALYLSYYSRVVAVDMLTDTEIWSRDMTPAAADRGSVSLDGTKLFVPAGEDYPDPYDFVLDTATGKTLTQFTVTPKAHDTPIGASGKYAYLETKSSPIVRVVDIATEKVIRDLKFGANVGPLVVDSADKYIYANVFDWYGLEVGDVTTGQVVARVQAMDSVLVSTNSANGATTMLLNHGIALKPDETELWVASKYTPSLFVFDVTVMPPKQVKTLSVGSGYGNVHWITFSLDGSYVYPAPDKDSGTPVQVYDAKTYKPTGATLAYTEEMFEVDFAGGKVVAVGDQYGLGRKSPRP
jgi:glutamine cyclotransferase